MSEILVPLEGREACFRCPCCGRMRTFDPAAFGEPPPRRFRLRCGCGAEAVVRLEKRRCYRKEVDLPGQYLHYVDGRPQGKGTMRVRDLSTRGMKLFVDGRERFAPGDLLKVVFHLDDAARSRLEKKLIVRNVNPPYVGAEFAPTEVLDKALGFYLRG